MIKDQTFKLYNGVLIPAIGFGTWQAKDGDEAYNATLYALKAGYRHIDTAYVYGNEESVGRAIKDSGIKREEIFITSKLPANIKSYGGALAFFKESIEKLGVEYLDLYLIHAPWPWDEIGANYDEDNVSAWRGMIDLYRTGRIKAIGVSNFNVHDINNLIDETHFKPMVNQIRYFIGNRQDEITDFCQKNDILVEAYSPLATGELVNNSLLKEIADKYNKSIPQICIRYCLQKNTLPLPKSVNENRIKANIDIDFEIDSKDMEYLDSLNHIGSVKKCRS